METVTDPIPPNNGANRGGTITKDKKDNLTSLTTTRISSDIGYRLTNLPRVVIIGISMVFFGRVPFLLRSRRV